MNDKLEIHGKTVEQAVSEALLQMGARKDEVKITVLEEPKSGFLGILGSRQAKVLVERKGARRGRGRGDYRDQNQDAIAHDLGGSSGGGRRRGRGSRGGRSGSRQGRPDQAKADQPKSDQSRNDQSRNDQSRNDQSRNNQSRSDQPRSGQPKADEAKGRQGGGSRGGRKQGGDESKGQERSGGRRGRQGSGSRDQGSGRGRSDRSGGRPRQDAAARPENFGNTMPVDGNETSGNTLDQGPREPRRGRHPRSNSDQPVRREGGQESRGRNNRNNRNARYDRGDQNVPNDRNDENTRSDANRRDTRNDRNQESSGRGGRGRGGRSQDSRSQNQGGRNSNPSPVVEQVPDTMIVTGLKAKSYASAVRDVPEEALNDTVCDFTSGVLVRAGFPCRCEVKEGEYRQVRVTTGDDSAGMLIGRHGSTVDAVEHLIERMMGVAAGDRVRMNLDINNYRRRREDTLVERVAEAVDRVKETERDYHMEPMCARERRLIHLETEKFDGIRTYTLMRSGDKHVVLALDKGDTREVAPEEESSDNESTPAVETISSVEVMMDTSLESESESAAPDSTSAEEPMDDSSEEPRTED
jgi:predicted RNA-binding protein Jag